MNDEMKTNLSSEKPWLRLLYMILFACLVQVAGALMWVLVILQFLFSLFTGSDNENLRGFGAALSRYVYQTLQFLTYNSEDKPFPFADWPASEETRD